MVDSDTMICGLQLESDFRISFTKAITRVQTSPNVDISRNSNDRISVVRDATVTWLIVQVVLHILCMLV